MIGVVLSLLFLFQADMPAFSAAPGESGAWLFRDGAWSPMSTAAVSEVKTRGLDNYIYTDGYTNLDMDVSFAGPRAALRVSARRPVFIATRPEGDDYEPILVRLERKKDRRVCRTRPPSASIGNKQGFRKQDIVSTVLTVNPDKSFIVRPERPLKPGEYLFVTGSPVYGLDFGVD
ncbi:MAG: hypothetical protein FWF13_02075 [Acidobacteria bacterium]|nr:hypothetical protein [Acidobacteriota bacterium]